MGFDFIAIALALLEAISYSQNNIVFVPTSISLAILLIGQIKARKLYQYH